MSASGRFIGLLVLGVVFPISAHAAVIVSEIMYDLPGTDSGREWIEITNIGTDAVGLNDLTLFEANTNHAVTAVSGPGTLQPGSSAILVSDPTKFKADWPNYAGTLLDSSFSLSNGGESLELRQGEVALASASYDPSVGAAGDGNTLQWNGYSFGAAAPTPGSYAGSTSQPFSSNLVTSISSTTPTGEDTNSSARSAFTYVPPPTALFMEVHGSRTATREVPLRMSVRVTTKGGSIDPLADVTWSFGDGSSSMGTAVEKTYRHPGTYLVVVRAVDGLTEAQEEFSVTVTSADVVVSSVSGEGITLTNGSNQRVDLSGWRIVSDTFVFRIPDGMALLPGSSVLLPREITNLPIAFEATLQYPNGITASHFEPKPQAVTPPDVAPMTSSQPLAVAASYESVGTMKRSDTYIKQPVVDRAEITTTSHDEEIVAPTAAHELAAVGAALPVAADESDSTVARMAQSPLTLGLFGVIIAAAVVSIFL